MTVQKVVDFNCRLGESPVWDDDRSAICWIDILGEKIHELSTVSGLINTLQIGQPIGSIALDVSGNLLAALKHDIVLINRLTGQKQEVVASPEAGWVNNRSNDGKCDAMGRFWFGTKSLSDEPEAGNVYRIADGACSLQIPGVTISNGIAWSIDNRFMYYIDTPTFRVTAFDYDLQTGTISNKRPVIEIAREEGYPDGMTIDTEGMLWIAHWGGGQVARWNPHTGEKVSSFQIPVANVTSCTFGGAALGDLYITTAGSGNAEPGAAAGSNEGGLFVIKNCGFRGMPANRFSNKKH